MRNAARQATIGRQQAFAVSGPPLTWENDGAGSSRSSTPSGSGESTSSSVHLSTNARPNLPPKPASSSVSSQTPSTPSRRVSSDGQSTLRNMPTSINGSPNRREVPSPCETYQDEHVTVSDANANDHHPEDNYSETAMLDSVILPAIASVRVPDVFHN